MNAILARWFGPKWQKPDASLLQSYLATFSSLHGQRVLQHLLDSIYCTTYEGNDPNAALVHNARRGVINEILQILDSVEHPQKYEVRVEKGDGLAR